MKKAMFLGVIVMALSSAGGCAWTRSIEQWKCDNLGWCPSGTRPSNQVQVGYPSTCAPVTGGCAPVMGMPITGSGCSSCATSAAPVTSGVYSPVAPVTPAAPAPGPLPSGGLTPIPQPQ